MAKKSLKDLYADYQKVNNIDFEDPSVIVGSSPEELEDMEVPRNPDDILLEGQYDNEEFVANEALEPDEDQSTLPIPPPQVPLKSQSDVRNLEGITLNKTEALSEYPSVPQDQSSFESLMSVIKPQASNELREAQLQRGMNDAYAQIQRGAALAGAGIAGRGVSAEPVMKIIDKGAELSGRPVEEYTEQVANQKFDANSTMSQVLRDYLKKKGIPVADNYSANDILAVAPFLAKDQAVQAAIQKALLGAQTTKAKMEQQAKLFEEAEKGKDKRAQLYQEGMKGRQESIEKQRKITNLSRFQQDFNKDQLVQKANQGLQSALDAEQLLHANTPISSEAIKTALARLSGEVGVLTDRDIDRFAGSRALAERVKQGIKTLQSGKLTEANRQDMKQITDIFKKSRESKIKERAEFFAKQGGKRFDVSPDEAYDYLYPGEKMGRKSEEQGPASSEVERLDPKSGKTAIFDGKTKKFLRWK